MLFKTLRSTCTRAASN